LSSSPAIGFDGTVYIGSDDGKVYALDGSTGAKKWEFLTGNRIGPSSPCIGFDETVYIGSYDSKVYALEGTTGAKKWEFLTGGQVSASPAIGRDGTIYIGSSDGKVYALDGVTGAKRWEYLAAGGVASSAAIGVDGTVFVGSSARVYALDGATGTRKWEFTILGYGSSPAIASGGTVYIGSGEGKLYALNSETGANKWEFESALSILSHPAIDRDGTVYLQHNGEMIAFEGTGPPAPSSWPKFGGDSQNTRRVDQTAPFFPSQRKSILVMHEGRSDKHEIRVTGSPKPQLRWFHNGMEIVGKTNTSLTIATVTRADEGTYWVVASNELGQVTSEPIFAIVSNVEPLGFAGFQWQGAPGAAYALESRERLGSNEIWQTLTNYAAAEPSVLYVEANASLATRYYRLNGANASRFTKIAFVQGWWFTNSIGSEHVVEYMAEPSGWTNWNVLTNLVLSASPSLFLDYESFDQPGRIYRVTPR